jgi:glycosyltransferase involved in cell wall biosynthesis
VTDPQRPLLTICILHYEAIESLGTILDSLCPFTSVQTEVLVCDNSTKTDCRPLIAERQQAFDGRLTLHKHACNIGMSANILRCFELARGEFVWLVGCADRFLPDGVSVVERILTQGDDDFVMFKVNGLRGEPWPPRTTYSRFLTAFRDLEFGPITNLNSVIYRTDVARRYLAHALLATASLIPHVAILAAALDGRGSSTLTFHPRQVFERSERKKRSWDVRGLFMNLSTVYPDFTQQADWIEFRNTVYKSHHGWFKACLIREQREITVNGMLRLFGQFGLQCVPMLASLTPRLFLKKPEN